MSELPPLFHFCAEPLGELHSCAQVPRERNEWTFADKPHGLWVSVGDDWAEWCKGSEFKLEALKLKYRISIKESAPLLLLSYGTAILKFQEEYGRATLARIGIDHTSIDWARVAENYAGIVIAPYQWSLRLELMWYYGWDCASGCIWDTSVIERVELVEDPS